jgi:SAM-dependent methyltransferase
MNPRLLRALLDRWPPPADVMRRIPHWCRIVMDRDINAFLETLPVGSLHALEVSGETHRHMAWKSHQVVRFPAFDLCTQDSIEPTADVVFCEQVLEHVVDPIQAVRNLYSLTFPGGLSVISVPFLIRIHLEPEDHWRFSPTGLGLLLSGAGFEIVTLKAWGHRRCVRANLRSWRPYVPFLHSLINHNDVPVVVWAIARRPPRRGC